MNNLSPILKVFPFHLIQDLQSRIPEDDLKLHQFFFQQQYYAQSNRCRSLLNFLLLNYLFINIIQLDLLQLNYLHTNTFKIKY